MYTYSIKGITLTMEDMVGINSYYEAASTAEYIMENFLDIDKDEALRIGYEVRRCMAKYDMNENEAIRHILTKMNMPNRNVIFYEEAY